MNPAPASTVMLVRQSPTNAETLETLLLLRNQSIAFGGTWVFPGGRVETQDYEKVRADLGAPGKTCAAERAFQAAIHAATRETYEEAGLVLAPKDLFSIAHWTTPARFERRFATWFFLCPVRETLEVSVDQHEIMDYQWVTANQALAQHDAGRLPLTQPTRHTLETLRQFRRLDTLCRDLEARSIHVYPDDSAQLAQLKLRRL